LRLIEPQQKSKQDVGIADAIDYFNSPKYIQTKDVQQRWTLLTPSEVEFINGELITCKDYFSYCARNYFQVVTKSKKKIFLELMPAQELILDSLQTLQDQKKPAKLLILKARQLGCSTLIEAIIAWVAMFYENSNCLVVSYDDPHTAYLFKIMQDFFDQMPWWMKPMVDTREYKKGLRFDNPDPDERSIIRPGMNSMISAQGAQSVTGVGVGVRFNAAHMSEVAKWGQSAKTIIEGDIKNALVEEWTTIAVIESTAMGCGNYYHNFWNKMISLGEAAAWYPKFYPWFMEPTRFLPPPNGWKPQEDEVLVREVGLGQWLKCSTVGCPQTIERFRSNIDNTGAKCRRCGSGIMSPLLLNDQQLYWREHSRINSDTDPDTLRLLYQELCTTAEESFQATGSPVFTDDVMNYVSKTAGKPKFVGFFDPQDNFHAVANAETYDCIHKGCPADHRFDNQDMQVWERPEPHSLYYIGVDVAQGIGQDYSCIVVLRIGRGGQPDRQVALFRSNKIDPIALSYIAKSVGKWYNEAEMAIEVNRFDTVATWLSMNLSYPRLYSQGSQFTATSNQSKRLGWMTNGKSKPRIVVHAARWLGAKAVIVRSPNLAGEIKSFQRDPEVQDKMEAQSGAKDDELMAFMIALHCAHEVEFDDRLGYIPLSEVVTADSAAYLMKCNSCKEKMPCNNPNDFRRCPKCGSIRLEFDANQTIMIKETSVDDFLSLEIPAAEPDYDML